MSEEVTYSSSVSSSVVQSIIIVNRAKNIALHRTFYQEVRAKADNNPITLIVRFD